MADGARLESYDVAIVGAGFSGLYMLHRLRTLGLTARVYEAGPSVGGTWYWNRYPGARVDIESQEYCYSFSSELDAEWQWSERYAAQPELLRYLNHVADRFALRSGIQLETRVTAAIYDDAARRWTVTTDQDEQISARHVVMATGCLSVAKEPDMPGAESFSGRSYHTHRWPEGVDFAGQRVAVIGTGSSAIQAIPQIATQAAHLTIFQRTPNFSVPAHNHPTDPQIAADWANNRAQYRREARDAGFAIRAVQQREDVALEAAPEQRTAAFEERWARGGFSLLGAYSDLIFSKDANDTAVQFVADKIRGTVKDPVTAEKLIPKTYPIGSKRICVDTGYYETFNRPNVSLVDLTDTPITAITPTGVRTTAGEQAFDAIVYAIGFDAMTGALSKIGIRGRGGARLSDSWAEGPKSYLGLMVAGFPNLFIVTGPGSPSVLSNMAVSIEQHVEWISDCIAWMGQRQAGAIEATEEAQEMWVAHVNEVADLTVYPQANSWYMGANVPGKPRVFMPYIGGFPAYRDKCAEVAAKGYEGFAVTADGRA
ncbi:MAG: NAD(P)/FAD-dependent oxidoreductase [Alphaproteobacteria bacterium]|nr:NAD(P)/FAD-dependent oxidoreductase [Alphaproteobacteria bacterium]MBU1515983.1 NAD(P)/FAD-dependent oxidoreductase [Alphaproteobacteria bacterium]MBU2092802.1 NAD(P)/FAD-dependent oxidoreductase [Alphaproteobacteria bacterium]MBU2153673.1 NAD(P)/FAD-dependent oxidoreductase [Alphaproteobacteria bacterium]MBU2308301.1 NAD(P)/FAD-dependent oxidoreductase [Alphaproteobacteria bacterium]